MADDDDDDDIILGVHSSIDANTSSDEDLPPISLANSRRPGIHHQLDQYFARPARQVSMTYARAELSSFASNFEPDPQRSILHAHPTHASLEVDGGSGLYSRMGSGPDVPYTSMSIQNQQRTQSRLSMEESSPKGSPEQKYEEFVPNTPLQPDRPRFQSRIYTESDINTNTERGRLATYRVYGWTSTSINKRVLAKAGFYYEGHADEVICVSCDGSLRGWQPGDDPIEEHYEHFDSDCIPNYRETDV